MKIADFIKKTNSSKRIIRPGIFCKDGFYMSVQCSSFHYCTPRIDNGIYSSVEIGFPTEIESLLLKYAEDEKNPINTVYGYVPVNVVDSVIEKHGGIDMIKTFKKSKS